MTYALGTATGKIQIEYDGSGVKKAEDDIDGLQDKASKSGESLDKVGKGAGIAGAAIAGGLALGVKAAADFESRISAVGAVSGATGGELDKLRDKALQLGKDTSFSADEGAQAIEELVKAGLTVDEVLNGAADATVNLAAAGEVALPEAAAIASNAMNQFNLTAEDMVKVADNIAGAANASAIDVSEFGYSLSQAGAVANLAGVSFEDTATAIALMGNAGIKGSDAGTSLKSMLSRLQPTTQKTFNEMTRLGLITFDVNTAMETLAENGIKGVTKTNAEKKLQKLAAELSGAEVGSAKAEKKFQELGLQSGFLANQFYDAEGNTKSLADISGLLGKSLEGMSKRQKQATLQTLFGADAIRSAAILANEGSKGFNNMAKSMNKVSAAEVAEKRLDNFKGSLEAMKGSLETAGIAIGTVLLPPLRSLVDAITSAFNWFLNLSDGTQKVIVGVLAAVGAILLIVAGIIKLVSFITAAKAAFIAIRGVMATTWIAALGPIALVIAAIAAIVGIIILLWKKSETFRNIVLAVWGAIQKAAMAVANWFAGPFVEFFTSAWDTFMAGLTAIKDFFVSVWNAIKTAVMVVFQFIAGIIKTYINVWKTIITTALNIILGVWKAVWGLFGPLVKAIFDLIVAIIKLAWTIIKGVFILAFRGLKKIFTAAWNFMVKIVKGVWNTISKLVSKGLNFIQKIIETVFGAIRKVTEAVWNGIKAVFQAVWGFIGPYVKQGITNLKNNITRVWNLISDVTKKVWDFLSTIVGNAIDKVVDTAKSLKDRILGFFSNAGKWLYDKGRDIIQGLIDGITGMIKNVTGAITNVTDKIADFLPGSPVKDGPLQVLNRGYAGKKIIEMLVSGVEASLRPVADVSGLVGETMYSGIDTAGIGASHQPASTTNNRSQTFNIYNPSPERSSRSVSKVLHSKVDEEGWGR